MASANQVAGYIAATPQSGYWPGLSTITQTFENYFKKSGAVEIGGASAPTDYRGSFKAAAIAASKMLTAPADVAAPVVAASVDVVQQAGKSAGRALDAAENALESAGKTTLSTIEKIGTGLEWGLIAIGVLVALWIIAQASQFIPRKA